jgi:hypothetical protein
MKKVIYILLLTILTCVSCSLKSNDYTGTWKGNVFIVFIEYTFTKDTFVQHTYSFNDVLVGGSSGSMTVENGLMKMTEERRYMYDSNKNTGQWGKSNDQYTMKYSISGKTITLQPDTSKESMQLVKE